jgi:hypothetical protein
MGNVEQKIDKKRAGKGCATALRWACRQPKPSGHHTAAPLAVCAGPHVPDQRARRRDAEIERAFTKASPIKCIIRG